MLAIVALRHQPSLVTNGVWTRGVIITLSSALLLVAARRTTQGSNGAYRRLRIISTAMIVAAVASIVLPGSLPLWMKIEQGACALILRVLLATASAKSLRKSFQA